MRKVFLVIAAVIAVTISSCRCPKCPVTVRVTYVVPEFVCPVPGDPALTAITPEIVSDDAMFKKVMGDNIIVLKQSIALWRGVYYECVQSVLKLYRAQNESDAESIVP